MRLRYAGICSGCGADIPKDEWAFYDRAGKTVHCIECPETGVSNPPADAPEFLPPQTTPELPQKPQPVAPELGYVDGVAGASARQEFERRAANREKRVLESHPLIGEALLSIAGTPQHVQAWDTGAVGEERIGEMLSKLAGPMVRVLHDRGIPTTKANIDHIVITSRGVYVIDAKRYKGRPEYRSEGGILRPKVEHLFVNGREQTKLVDGAEKQVRLVQAAVSNLGDIWVGGYLCFLGADWPAFGGDFMIRQTSVLWPRKMSKLIRETPGPINEAGIAEIHRRLAETFPPA